jgi:hypothetical protein
MAKLGRIALRDREAVFGALFENISPSSPRRPWLSHIGTKGVRPRSEHRFLPPHHAARARGERLYVVPADY